MVMGKDRKAAVIVGVLFIIGTVGYSIGVVAFVPVLDDPDYLVEGSANEGTIVIGALFTLISGAAIASIPFVMLRFFRRRNETLAAGYAVFRLLEMVCIVGMVIVVFLLLSLSQGYVDSGTPEDSYHGTIGAFLLEAYDLIDLITVLVFAMGAHIFYYMLHVTRLVPRTLSVWGLIGASAWLAAGVLGMFGIVSNTSVEWMLLALPIAVNEMVLALWLIVKGFDNPSSSTGPEGRRLTRLGVNA
jgi:hypothetical protein